MVDFVSLTADFATGAQVSAEDFAAIRAAGFASVLNARPDDETGEYLTAAAAREAAAAAGLAYAHAPTDNHAIFEPEVIDAFEAALARLPRPVFAHCKSGTRATILWALVACRYHDVEEVIATLRAAGQELDFLEQEMREAAAATRHSPFLLKDHPLLAPKPEGQTPSAS